MRFLRLGILVALVLVPTASAAIDPYDFQVDLRGGPDMRPSDPSCRPDGPDAQICTQSMNVLQTGVAMKGTVKNLKENLSGTIETTCDMAMKQTMSMRMSGSSTTLVELEGSGTQSCAWAMKFSEGSAMSGAFSGSMRLAKASETAASFRGTMTVTVVAGTGKFADQVGTGTFAQNETMSVVGGGQNPGTSPPPPGSQPPPPPGTAPPPPPPTGQPRCIDANGNEIPCQPPLPPGSRCFDPSGTEVPCPTVSLYSLETVEAAVADASKLKLRLRKGRPLARIATPGRMVEAKSAARLRVTTAPGAACSAVAVGGARRVALGSARDSNRDGIVVFSSRLGGKLAVGRWTLTAHCAYRLRGKSGTVSARSNVLVAR